MEIKSKMKLIVRAFVFCCCFVHILTSPLAAPKRLNKITEHSNSLYVRDVMRLAKAYEMQNYMNTTLDPCKDFYEFACGNWGHINPTYFIASTGLFENLSKGLTLKVTQIFNDDTPNANDTETDKKVINFYKSCMKLQGKKEIDFKAELMAIIAEFGVMPAIEESKFDANNFDWLETIAKIYAKYGIQIIFSVDIMGDFQNNTVNRAYFGNAELKLKTKSMYKDNQNWRYRLIYSEQMANDLVKYFGLDPITADAVASDMVQFEVKLANGMIDDKLALSLNDKSLLTTVAELQQKYAPEIDFEKYTQIVFGERLTEPVYEYVESYQQNLKNVVLKKVSKQELANYIFYKLIEEFLPKVKSDNAEQEQRCAAVVKEHFAKNLDNMIYRRHNTQQTERDVNNVWEAIKTSFKMELYSDKLKWIAPHARSYAFEKLDAMRMEINSYMNENFTEEFDELVIDQTHFFENLKNIFQLKSKKARAKLHEPPKPLELGEVLSYTPANVILENMVKVPVALLQPNYLWSKNYPTALKYGTLGFLLGHELIHGFDDTGRAYDKYGNSHNWWDETSTQAFNNRTKCFTEQYAEYVFGGVPLPFSEMQSENIADNGGLRLAYDAYLRWRDEAMRDGFDLDTEKLPNLDFNDKQLFFISFAQVWCSETHPALRILQASSDSHTPAKFRVIGTLSNFMEFSKEFNCERHTPMNPVDKCEIY